MRLSSLLEQVRAAPPDVLESCVYLAAPDPVVGDEIDVRLAPIGKVDIDRAKNEITLIPVVIGESSETGIPIILLKLLLEQLPFDTALWGDFQISVELPFDREAGHPVMKSRVKIEELYIGKESGEAWLLVRPCQNIRVMCCQLRFGCNAWWQLTPRGPDRPPALLVGALVATLARRPVMRSAMGSGAGRCSGQ
jgi:hypothetical protein